MGERQGEIVGVHYCTEHEGTRNEDDGGPCDMGRDDVDDTECVFHTLLIGEPLARGASEAPRFTLDPGDPPPHVVEMMDRMAGGAPTRERPTCPDCGAVCRGSAGYSIHRGRCGAGEAEGTSDAD